MADRTLKFYGQGYGTETVNINVTMDGTEVFSGPIVTSDAQPDPNTQEILFNTTISPEFTGSKAVVITVTGGSMMFGRVTANYSTNEPNPVYSPEQYATITDGSVPRSEKLPIWEALAVPPLTAEDETLLLNGTFEEIQPILVAHNIEATTNTSVDDYGCAYAYGDSRANVVVNGYAMASPEPTGGDWSWLVPLSGETGTLTYTQMITAAPPAVV
jgi:hypothetical protein